MSCLDLELEARVWVNKSCWTASSQMRQESHYVSTFPRVHSKAANPSSHAKMAISLLPNYLSRAGSCPSSSTATTFHGGGALHQSTSNDQCHDKEESPGKLRHRVKTPPNRWRCPTGGDVLPCLKGQRLAAIMAGAPAGRTYAVVTPISHHGQWSGGSFKISGEERRFLSKLAEDRKRKVSGSAPRYLYHREKLKRSF
jgi:hypothetical protein